VKFLHWVKPQPAAAAGSGAMRTFFNPTIEQMLACKTRKILFVHVGKCAGESIVSALAGAIGNGFTLFEMHVANANHAINIAMRDHAEEFIFLIAKRDPLQRFVSAFNWDKHNLFLRGNLKDTQFALWFEAFPTAEILGKSLSSEYPEICEAAKKFSMFAHMGMGQSWYTPMNLLQNIPNHNIHVVDMNSLQKDIENFISKQLKYNLQRPLTIPHTKGDYRQSYTDGKLIFPNELSDQAAINLRERLREDYKVYDWLTNFAGASTG
jgi:Sulfotransferase family